MTLVRRWFGMTRPRTFPFRSQFGTRALIFTLTITSTGAEETGSQSPDVSGRATNPEFRFALIRLFQVPSADTTRAISR